MKSKLLAFAAVLGGYLLFSASPSNTNDMTNIQTFLTNQVKGGSTPSVQYAFFDTNEIIYQVCEGFAQVGENKKVDSSTMYHLYSITKICTALAVLQLAEQGKIDLKKSAAVYMTNFPYDKSITIEQLLSHTAGIPNPMPLRWIHLEQEHKSFDHDGFFANIFRSQNKTVFEPGTDFKYSNLGYVFLGQLVEQVTGQAFDDYVTEHIFKPSGITQLEISFVIDSSRHATGYQKQWSVMNGLLGFLIDKKRFMGPAEKGWKPFRSFYNNGTAYGGLFGSSAGLIKYAQALLKKDSPILSISFKEILFSETKINDQPTGMSMSWFTGSLKGHRYVAHAGGGGGYYVELRLYPDLSVGSVLLYNRSGMRDERALDLTDGFFLTNSITFEGSKHPS